MVALFVIDIYCLLWLAHRLFVFIACDVLCIVLVLSCRVACHEYHEYVCRASAVVARDIVSSGGVVNALIFVTANIGFRFL